MKITSGPLHLPKSKFSNPADSHAAGSPVLRKFTDAELVLIRGLPGSGKSTMARTLAMVGYEHHEADQLFQADDTHQFDPQRIRETKWRCQYTISQALAAGKRVVVSGTFSRLHEMEPYLGMTRNLRIVEAMGKWNNPDNVSAAVLAWLAEYWEPLPEAWAAR